MKADSSIHYQTEWLLKEAGGRSHITTALERMRDEQRVQALRVVELGSGIGTNLQVFSATNEVVGIEGMASAVEESRRRGIPAIQSDLESNVPLPSSSADWLLCIDVLEHLMNPEGCLREAHRILHPQGHLVINVPNHFDWRGRLKVLRGSGIDSQGYFPDSPHWAYPHVRFFSRESIEALLRGTGFAVQEDLAPRYLSFPKAHVWRRVGLAGWMHRQQQRHPNLFTSGFLLRCKKVS